MSQPTNAIEIRAMVTAALARIPDHVLEDAYRGVTDSSEGMEGEWASVIAFIAALEYLDLPWAVDHKVDTPKPDIVGAAVSTAMAQMDVWEFANSLKG